jgi:hypothetical protein
VQPVIFAGGIDPSDIVMIQPSHCTSFESESAHIFRIGREVRWENFNRSIAA